MFAIPFYHHGEMERKADSLYPSYLVDFTGGLNSKESACNVGDLGSSPGLGRYPGERNGNPLQYFFPGKSHGWKSLEGHSPWCCKELDMTWETSLSFSFLPEIYRHCHMVMPLVFQTQVSPN